MLNKNVRVISSNFKGHDQFTMTPLKTVIYFLINYEEDKIDLDF